MRQRLRALDTFLQAENAHASLAGLRKERRVTCPQLLTAAQSGTDAPGMIHKKAREVLQSVGHTFGTTKAAACQVRVRVALRIKFFHVGGETKCSERMNARLPFCFGDGRLGRCHRSQKSTRGGSLSSNRGIVGPHDGLKAFAVA